MARTQPRRPDLDEFVECFNPASRQRLGRTRAPALALHRVKRPLDAQSGGRQHGKGPAAVKMSSSQKVKGGGRDAAAGVLQGHAVLDHQKKYSGQAETDQLRDPQVRDGYSAMPAQRRGAEAQDEHHQHVKAQQHGRQGLAGEHSDDVVNQEDAEADQQYERGSAQPHKARRPFQDNARSACECHL